MFLKCDQVLLRNGSLIWFKETEDNPKKKHAMNKEKEKEGGDKKNSLS